MEANTSMNTIERDVVIIGAGASGLSAATSLTKAGLSVAVLEARDRIGGRLWTDTIDGQMREIGGQWVSPDQEALIKTLADLGLETYERYRDGDSLYISRAGELTHYTGDIFPVPAETQGEIERLIALLDTLTAEIDPEAPWTHARAEEFDNVTWKDWLSQQTDDVEARDNIAMFIAEAMLTKPAHAFSLLQALQMASSAGSFSNLVDEDFILDKRVVGGLQQVPLTLAANLGDDVVFLSQPVRTVQWSADGVTAIAESMSVKARFVIMAVPPNLYHRVSFEPPLPRRQQQMHQHQSIGFVIKVHATYATPFWRDAGLSGTCFSPYALVHEAYDNTNHGETQGTLVGFVSDENADRLFTLTEEERRAEILASLATYFGDEALSPETFYLSDWGVEEWTRGAYATSFDMGGLHRYGADMRAPVGPIYWSSSDLAGAGFQHVDGAIRIGWATADAIIARA